MRLKFITGGAGTGKSYTLKDMVANDTDKHVVVAPTGIAAINCKGLTVHSAFRINPTNGFVSPSIQYGPLRGTRRIYLDEVSMVSSDLLQSIVAAADLIGCEEIIAFGDLAQLKPVKGNWFFEYMEPEETTKLEKVYRQENDLVFAEILNRIRRGTHTMGDIEKINQLKGDPRDGVTLAYSNATVDDINRKALAMIQGPLIENAAAIDGEMKPSDCIAPEVLQIKVGAQVIMLNNDQSRPKRWQNGTRGTVFEIVDKGGDEPPVIKVQIGDNIYDVYEYTWLKHVPRKLTEERREYWQSVVTGQREMSMIELLMLDDRKREEEAAYAQHVLRNGYEPEVVGTFTQFPMKLGYASTVHKSQGLTLDQVIIQPDGFGTSHGLGYVALSRLTSLAGLTTFRKLRRDDFICNPKVKPWL